MIADFDFAAEIEARRARQRPALPYLDFSAPELIDQIRSELFPEIAHEIELFFVAKGPLACVYHSTDKATIYIHEVLNHSDTPKEILSLIVKHELLHLTIRPVVFDGKTVQHPPEFWEAEKQLCPERQIAWNWITANFYECLNWRKKQERIDVRRNWKKVWCEPKLEIAKCAISTVEHDSGEGGW